MHRFNPNVHSQDIVSRGRISYHRKLCPTRQTFLGKMSGWIRIPVLPWENLSSLVLSTFEVVGLQISLVHSYGTVHMQCPTRK